MREKRSYAQEVCVKSAGKAMQQTGMIWPGCRIGVTVSGGVDSFVLLKTLHIRQGIVPFRFEIMAIHLNPGFDPQSHMPLAAWLSQHGIPSHLEVTDFGPHAHSAENQRRSPCFRCAWLRRKRLFELCSQYRLTHLALDGCESIPALWASLQDTTRQWYPSRPSSSRNSPLWMTKYPHFQQGTLRRPWTNPTLWSLQSSSL